MIQYKSKFTGNLCVKKIRMMALSYLSTWMRNGVESFCIVANICSSNTILLKEMRRRIQKRGGNCSLLSQVTWWSKTWLKISEPPLSQKFVSSFEIFFFIHWNFCANDEVKKSLIKNKKIVGGLLIKGGMP